MAEADPVQPQRHVPVLPCGDAGDEAPEARQDPTKRLIQGAGDYNFRLKINIAAPPEPSLVDRLQGRTQPVPISVQMTLLQLDHRGLMQMRNKEWLALAGGR